MTSRMIRLTLLLFSLASVGVLLVQARPHHDTELLSLLLPDDCTAPCFIGIRPGTTTANEAIQLLENHPWIQSIEIRFTDFRQQANTFWGYVYWDWLVGTPLFTKTSDNRLGIHRSYLRVLDGVVDEVAFTTSLPLGEVVAALGKADRYELSAMQYKNPPYPIVQNFFYPQAHLFINSTSLCPALSPDWYQNTMITVWNSTYATSFMNFAGSNRLNVDEARSQARQGCG